jgi:hypothetical protein
MTPSEGSGRRRKDGIARKQHMKNALSVGLIVLFLTTTAHAQEKDRDKLFWSLAAAAQVATVYDVNTTLRTLDRCPACYEANPIMRPFVRNSATAYSAGLGLSAVGIYGSKKLKERGSRWWWVPLVSQIGVHTALGIRNSHIR